MTTIGRCGGCSNPAHLLHVGDTDCAGYAVGYIDDAGGLAWESRREYLVATNTGRVLDGLRHEADLPKEILDEILMEIASHRRIQLLVKRSP